MTLGMRIRLWLRDAPRSHVAVTAVVAALVATLLVPSVLSVDRSDEPVAAGVSTATGASTPQSGRAKATADARTPAANAAGTAPATRNSVASAGSGSDGAHPSDAGVVGAATDEPRTASDRGIAPDTIKVGFLIAQLGGLDATGFALGFRDDQAQAAKAFVDHANAEGGVNGRKIVFVTTKSDPLSAQSMRAACVKMTQDEKVFSVIDTAASIGSTMACYAEQQTPHVFASGATVDEAFFRAGNGYNVSSAASGSRALLNWVDFAAEAGEIGADKGKLGILSDECAPGPSMIDRELKPLLKERGVVFFDVRVSCDNGAAQQQIPGAVLQMRQAGVKRVFLAVIFSTAQTFIQNAESQQWRPKYSVSDYWGLNLDFSAKNFNADQFDGTRSFTFSHSGEEAAHIEYAPAVKECSKILTDAGLKPITEQMNRDSEVLTMCGDFQLWLTAMRRTPANPTRADWINAVQTLGDAYTTTYSQRAVYGPGKFNAGDSYATIEWRRGCGCWVQIAPHRTARR